MVEETKSDLKFAAVCLVVAALAIRAINQNRSLKPKKKYTPATPQQYTARLTEFFDEPSYSEAMRHFLQLTEAGVHPDHAFDMVTRVVYQ